MLPSVLLFAVELNPILTQENKASLSQLTALMPLSEEKSLSRVRFFATPWTVAYQVPPSIRFSRQECWSGLPFPSPGDLPDPGIEPGSPALQADALPSEPPGKPNETETGLYRTVESELSGSLNTSLNYMYLVSQSCLTLCDPMDL